MAAVWLRCVAVVLVMLRVEGFNVDVKHALVLDGTPGSYFGYSVALRGAGPHDASLVVGAPRDNSTFPDDVGLVEPGVTYECSKSSNGRRWLCDAMNLGPSVLIQNVENFRYELMKDHAGYGAAMDVSASRDAPLVVCGPGLKNAVDSNYWLNGICFVTKKSDNDVQELLPLINNDKQQTKPDKFPDYAYGEAGLSVHLTKNATELLIGAPGVLVWFGTVIKYSMRDLTSEPIIVDPRKIPGLTDYNYFGFSVSSGKFFSSLMYVSGAPRGADLKGKVLLFSFPRYTWTAVQVHTVLQGRQIGEYFGSTLGVLDLNNDGYDDLLVGAPWHSIRGDEGRVYAFLGSAQGKLSEVDSEKITGSSYPGANFGSSIASIGDINRDGYQDFAVGAPYEGSGGAVYIYHGSSDGLKSTPAQRISAEDVSSGVPLRGFGYSISAGLDVDGNHYNDVAVGAYQSAQAVILRSRPVVQLVGNLSVDVVTISLSELAFTLTSCLHVTGHFLPSKMEVAVVLKVDPTFKRALVDGQGGTVSYNTTASSSPGVGPRNCRSFPVKIKTGVEDFSNPMDVHMSMSLLDADSTPQGDLCETCPVADPGTKGTNMSVLFDNGCGDDAVCQTDLSVQVQLVNVTEPYVLDPEKTVQVAVRVASLKEPAYNGRFMLQTSSDVLFVRSSSCTQLPEPSILLLECSLGHRPLTNTSQPVTVVVELGLSKLDPSTTEVVFNVTAKSSGEEQTPSNNAAILALNTYSDTGPLLFGRSKPPQMYFKEQSDEPVMITHVYEVRSSGPSQMSQVDVELLVPAAASAMDKSLHLIYMDNVTGQLGASHLTCTWMAGGAWVASDRAPGGDATNTTLQVSCNSQPDTCTFVKCRGVGPFPTTRTAAVITLHLRASSASLYSALEKKKFIEVQSMGRVVYTLLQNSVAKRNNSSVQGTLVAAATATSVLIADVVVEKVQPWILLLAILAGLLLLLLIVLGMYKAGFFKRRRHDDYGQLHEGTVLVEKAGPSSEE